MSGVPHPRGFEYGKVYAAPEEALAGNDKPLIISLESFSEKLNDPEIGPVLSNAYRLFEDRIRLRLIAKCYLAQNDGIPGIG